MNTTPSTPAVPVRIPANHTVTKRLGNWTTARHFLVRAHRGYAVLDLRSPQILGGDIQVGLDIDHAVLTLLVTDDAVIDDWDVRRVGRGRVKDSAGPDGSGGRRIVLSGQLQRGEIRVRRGGIAILSAMCSRAYLADLWQAYQQGGFPTVDDPTRIA
jgi:hypothetical protein